MDNPDASASQCWDNKYTSLHLAWDGFLKGISSLTRLSLLLSATLGCLCIFISYLGVRHIFKIHWESLSLIPYLGCAFAILKIDSVLSVAVINTVDKSNLAEERIHFSLYSRSQSIIERSQGKDSRQDPRSKNHERIISHRCGNWPIWSDKSPAEVPSCQVTLGCIKLTIKANQSLYICFTLFEDV